MPAAQAVFAGSWPVTMVGLDLTHQALATADLQDRVRAIGGDLAQFVLDIHHTLRLGGSCIAE